MVLKMRIIKGLVRRGFTPKPSRQSNNLKTSLNIVKLKFIGYFQKMLELKSILYTHNNTINGTFYSAGLFVARYRSLYHKPEFS